MILEIRGKISKRGFIFVSYPHTVCESVEFNDIIKEKVYRKARVTHIDI